MKIQKILPLLCLILLGANGFAQDRLVLDGLFSDWDHHPYAARDTRGDGAAGGRDFLDLTLSHDVDWLYLLIRMDGEVSLQNNSGIVLAIDTDDNPATGQSVGGIGAELIWRFGEKTGTAILNGSSRSITQSFGIHALPSLSSPTFEIALSRSAQIQGQPLFPSSRIRVALFDDRAGGDRIPDSGGTEWDFRNPGEPAYLSRSTDRLFAQDLRLLTWNTLQEGLTDTKRIPAFSRVLKALAPDILCFQECFSTTPAKALATVQAAFPPPPGQIWRAWKLDPGNVLVTWLAVQRSWLILDRYRASAFQLGVDGQPALLVINVHFRCCEADSERQKEVDAVVAFLREGKTSGGIVDLPEGLPIFIVGDYNFVGLSRQLLTLTTGDIEDNATFGPDARPGWNDTDLQILPPRHLATPIAYTWYDEKGTWLSGVLDYVLYSMPQGSIGSNFVFSTLELPNEDLLRLGVQATDTRTASDHLPRVVDIRPVLTSASTPPGIPRFSLYPQPCDDRLTLTPDPSWRGSQRVVGSDLLGRRLFETWITPEAGPATLNLPAFTPPLFLLQVGTESRLVRRRTP